MVIGAYIVIYSTAAEAHRAFLRDVVGLRGVDAGHGWLIFALPPAEVACHPAEENGRHELYLMCEDIERVARMLAGKNVACGPISKEPWGRLAMMKLPGGGELGIYQPKHPTALTTRS
jgi:hypothetical protein